MEELFTAMLLRTVVLAFLAGMVALGMLCGLGVLGFYVFHHLHWIS